jgi:hypothetical protein
MHIYLFLGLFSILFLSTEKYNPEIYYRKNEAEFRFSESRTEQHEYRLDKKIVLVASVPVHPGLVKWYYSGCSHIYKYVNETLFPLFLINNLLLIRYHIRKK